MSGHGAPGYRSNPTGSDPENTDPARHFRLLPRRKLPVLPPRGERWSGLTRPATLVAAGIVLVLVAVVWIGVATVRPSTPTTLDGVTAEVRAQVDELLATLPAPPSAVTEDDLVQACPDGSAGRQYALTTTVTPAGGFEARSWAAAVKEHFAAEDWRVLTEGLDDGGLTIDLVGPNLVPLTVTVTPGADAGAGSAITVTTESRCTRAP